MICGAVRRLDGGESRILFLCYHQVPRRDLAAFRSGLEALTAWHGGSPYQIRRLTMNPAWPPLAVLGRLHSPSPAVPGWS